MSASEENVLAILKTIEYYDLLLTVEACAFNPCLTGEDSPYGEEEHLQIVREFSEQGLRCVDWTDYRTRRASVETCFRTVMQRHGLAGEELDRLTRASLVILFELTINEAIQIWKEEGHSPDEEIPLPEDDVDVIDLARVLAHVEPVPADEAFCREIGVDYHYEQLHMVSWISSQITLGGGHYRRSEPNCSGRVTYNRLLNPRSLLWIGTVLGADREVLRQAAREAEGKKTNAARCGIVRRHVPFDDLLPGFLARWDELYPEEEGEDGEGE